MPAPPDPAVLLHCLQHILHCKQAATGVPASNYSATLRCSGTDCNSQRHAVIQQNGSSTAVTLVARQHNQVQHNGPAPSAIAAAAQALQLRPDFSASALKALRQAELFSACRNAQLMHNFQNVLAGGKHGTRTCKTANLHLRVLQGQWSRQQPPTCWQVSCCFTCSKHALLPAHVELIPTLRS